MKIMLNNKDEHFECDEISISNIMKEKKFTFKMLVVKINDKLIKKDEYDTSFAREGDNVMILHLISGG